MFLDRWFTHASWLSVDPAKPLTPTPLCAFESRSVVCIRITRMLLNNGTKILEFQSPSFTNIFKPRQVNSRHSVM